jgi:hypothetical protein
MQAARSCRAVISARVMGVLVGVDIDEEEVEMRLKPGVLGGVRMTLARDSWSEESFPCCRWVRMSDSAMVWEMKKESREVNLAGEEVGWRAMRRMFGGRDRRPVEVGTERARMEVCSWSWTVLGAAERLLAMRTAGGDPVEGV